MSMPLFVMYWECKMNKFMNQLIHDFMYNNVFKYSWHILDMSEKKEDRLYIRVASDISYKTAECDIHIYPNGDLDDSDSAAYNLAKEIAKSLKEYAAKVEQAYHERPLYHFD